MCDSLTLDIAVDCSRGFGRNGLTSGCNVVSTSEAAGRLDQDVCQEAEDRGTAQELCKGIW